MNNKRKKSNFLRNLLATASVASVIVGGSSSAFAVAARARITVATPAPINEGPAAVTADQAVAIAAGAKWQRMNNVGAQIADGERPGGPQDGYAFTFGVDNHQVVIDRPAVFQAINVADHAGTSTKLQHNLTVGSVVNVGGDQTTDFIFDNTNNGARDLTLTFTGEGATIHDYGFDADANKYATVGKIDFDVIAGGNYKCTLVINPAAVDDIEFTNLKVLHGDNATLTINDAGRTVTFKQTEVATAKTINIGNNTTVQFHSTATGAHTLNLQPVAGGAINFGADGTGKLLLTSLGGGNAKNFTVMHESLGGKKDGTLTDDYGVISFDATAATGILSNNAADTTVIGRDKEHRAKKLIVTANGANTATVRDKVYTKALELKGGTIAFGSEVYVGNDGKSEMTVASAVTFQDNSHLGELDFHNLAGTINVHTDKTLAGEFYGDKAHDNKRAGTIIFVGGNSKFDGKAVKLDVIEVTAANSILTFSGTKKNDVDQIRAKAAGVHFKFADSYQLTGNIMSANHPHLTFSGDAEISGTICQGADFLGKINITDKDKTVKLDTDTIKAANIFDIASGGTLALNNKTGNVTITSRISANGGGAINASEMKDKNSLIIIGNIGTDPSVTNSKALDKIVLAGQNLILQPDPAAGFANVAGIDFSKRTSTVQLDIAGANYALGALENAESAIVDISHNTSLYNTSTTDKGLLGEIRFKGDNILTLSDDDIAASSITTQNADQGSLVFAKNSTLKGKIGKGNRKLKEITVNANIEAITSGVAYLKEDVNLSNRSVLNVDSHYYVKRVVGDDAAGVGTLRFVNKDNVKLVTSQIQAANAGNAIDTLELNGGNVALVNNGISFKNINFTTKDAAMLTLDKNMKLAGVNVQSSATKRSIIQLANEKGDEITAGQHIGDKDHYVDLQFTKDIALNVKSQDAFIAVSTIVNNAGVVNFDVAGGNKLVVGYLGSEGHSLKEAHFKSNVENHGSTYVKEGTIYDGMTYTASGTVAGDVLKVGNTNGGAAANFNEGVILNDTLINVGTNNKVNFAGNATINKNIGTSDNKFGEIRFKGDKNSTAILGCDSINSKVANFGKENIKIVADVTFGAVSDIDANINLGSNKLFLKEGGTWGKDISIKTTLTESGVLGSIRLGNTVTVVGDLPVEVETIGVHIIDDASLRDYRDARFTLIDGDKYLVMKDGKVILTKMLTTNRVYTTWVIESRDGKQVITRKVNERAGMKADLNMSGHDPINDKNVDALLASRRGSDAEKFADDISRVQEKVRKDTMDKLFNSENEHVTTACADAARRVSDNIGNIVQNRNTKVAISAGSDDGNTSMGAWVMPYYSQATQNESKENKGSSIGYTTKSFGGVFGFDTLVNEGLTIGAAVNIAKTDMKFKGYKDEKAKIGTFGFSLYGSQQLDKNFFVQAVASFSSSKIDNTDVRRVSNKIHTSGKETAKASYNSTSFGGKLLFGYNAKLADSVLLTPTAGIRYTRFNDENYKETGTTHQNKIFGKKESNRVEAIIGARLATTIDTDGIVITPEAHASVAQRLSGKSGKVDARLDGMTGSFTPRPEKGGKTSYNVGIAVGAKAGAMEYGAGYDAYLANKYVGHQGTLKVRVNF
jgi:hypothetical protein